MGEVTETRKSRPSIQQKEALVNFLERNPLLTSPHSSRTEKTNLWTILTEHLNSLEGAQKQMRQWQRFLTDWKLALRKKISENNILPLTNLEERMNNFNETPETPEQCIPSTSTYWGDDIDIEVKDTNIITATDIDSGNNLDVQITNVVGNENNDGFFERKRKSEDLIEAVEKRKYQKLTEIGHSLTAIKVETTEMKNCMLAVAKALDNRTDTVPPKGNREIVDTIDVSREQKYQKLDKIGHNLEGIKNEMIEMKHCMQAIVKGVNGLTGAVTRLASVFEHME